MGATFFRLRGGQGAPRGSLGGVGGGARPGRSSRGGPVLFFGGSGGTLGGSLGRPVLGICGSGFGCSYQMEYRSIPVAGWPSESWPWARPCTWRHSQALVGAVFDHSPMAPPIVHPVKVCLAAGYSSGSRHPSKGWVRPKQAGWEFRVESLGFGV